MSDPKEKKKDILKVLAVFDSTHDFFSSRCIKLDNKEKVVDAAITTVLGNDYQKWKQLMESIGLNEGDEYKHAKEDDVIDACRKQLSIVDPTYQLKEITSKFTGIEQFMSSNNFLTDILPQTHGFLLDCCSNKILNDDLISKNDEYQKWFAFTIASYWDQSSNKKADNFIKLDLKQDEYIENSSPTNIFLKNESIELKPDGKPNIDFPKAILINKLFQPSVKNLCALLDLKLRDKTIHKHDIRENLIAVPSNAKKSVFTQQKTKLDTIVESLAELITSENGISTLLNLKQSGDDSQILSVKLLNDSSNSKDRIWYLLTCDRLCYFKSVINEVNAVYVDRNNNLKVYNAKAGGILHIRKMELFNEAITTAISGETPKLKYNKSSDDVTFIDVELKKGFVGLVQDFMARLRNKEGNDELYWLTETYIYNNINIEMWKKLAADASMVTKLHAEIRSAQTETENNPFYTQLDTIMSTIDFLNYNQIHELVSKSSTDDNNYMVLNEWERLSKTYKSGCEIVSTIISGSYHDDIDDTYIAFNSTTLDKYHRILVQVKNYISPLLENLQKQLSSTDGRDYSISPDMLDLAEDAFNLTSAFNITDHNILSYQIHNLEYWKTRILDYNLSNHLDSWKLQNPNVTVGSILKLKGGLNGRRKVQAELIKDVIIAFHEKCQQNYEPFVNDIKRFEKIYGRIVINLETIQKGIPQEPSASPQQSRAKRTNDDESKKQPPNSLQDKKRQKTGPRGQEGGSLYKINQFLYLYEIDLDQQKYDPNNFYRIAVEWDRLISMYLFPPLHFDGLGDDLCKELVVKLNEISSGALKTFKDDQSLDNCMAFVGVKAKELVECVNTYEKKIQQPPSIEPIQINSPDRFNVKMPSQHNTYSQGSQNSAFSYHNLSHLHDMSQSPESSSYGFAVRQSPSSQSTGSVSTPATQDDEAISEPSMQFKTFQKPLLQIQTRDRTLTIMDHLKLFYIFGMHEVVHYFTWNKGEGEEANSEHERKEVEKYIKDINDYLSKYHISQAAQQAGGLFKRKRIQGSKASLLNNVCQTYYVMDPKLHNQLVRLNLWRILARHLGRKKLTESRQPTRGK